MEFGLAISPLLFVFKDEISEGMRKVSTHETVATGADRNTNEQRQGSSLNPNISQCLICGGCFDYYLSYYYVIISGTHIKPPK